MGAPSLQAAAPHATGSGYVNFLTEDEAERVAASYGAQLPAPADGEAALTTRATCSA